MSTRNTLTFTALHRALGLPPGPITELMVDRAVAERVPESADLDWKSDLPPAKALSGTDFPKDVAAMANSGGGVIVYGVRERDKLAQERCDGGSLDEGHERALRSAAVSAISPPIFGLDIQRVATSGHRCTAVVIPASAEGPHLIYRNDLFGAPIRNDADTVWMREQQIESMYRARFDERRHAAEALTELYNQAAAGRDVSERAWMVAVAHPRTPDLRGTRPSRDEARSVFDAARRFTLTFATRGVQPLDSVDWGNPRAGLRRWVAPNSAHHDTVNWWESWVSIHHDGSVSIATALGGHRSRDGRLRGSQIRSSAIELVVADLMAVIAAQSELHATVDYDVRIGIEWQGAKPLLITTVDQLGFDFDGTSLPLHTYAPVTANVIASVDPTEFQQQVIDLAQDCVNQGGITVLQKIKPVDADSSGERH